MNEQPRHEPAHLNAPASLPAGFFTERFWIGTAAVILGALALLYVRFAFGVAANHDEVEHAHVAFRMLSGELPYRDFYQNHWPAWWLVVAPLVQAFPFSIKAILAARGLCLLALLGCWWLGLRLLAQVPGGLTKPTVVVYTAAVMVLAHAFEFYLARPDPLMALCCTAGLCLVPARGALRSGRALGLGILFGLALSLSSKMLPLVLVIPLLAIWQALRAGTLQPLLGGFAYAAGILLAVLPTVLWLAHYGLLEAFYFDVFSLNLALSKPWHQSFGWLSVAVFLPWFLGIVAWAWARNGTSGRDDNALAVVFLTLLCGLLLALTARHAGMYNLQALMVPFAVGCASLASFLWLRGRRPGSRLLILAALLAFPVGYTANLLLKFRGNGEVVLSELQQIMDLARPGGRTCLAFSPAHPVYCRSISQLSNEWDLIFTRLVRDPRQLARFHRVWDEGIEHAVDGPPDILLRKTPKDIWARAVKQGLIRQDQLDALDRLRPAYDARIIGGNEFWVRRATQ